MPRSVEGSWVAWVISWPHFVHLIDQVDLHHCVGAHEPEYFQCSIALTPPCGSVHDSVCASHAQSQPSRHGCAERQDLAAGSGMLLPYCGAPATSGAQCAMSLSPTSVWGNCLVGIGPHRTCHRRSTASDLAYPLPWLPQDRWNLPGRIPRRGSSLLAIFQNKSMRAKHDA